MKDISFVTSNKDVEACVDRPVSAKTLIPDWFKDIPRTIDDKGTSKSCVPFLDAFMFGYVQRLWCDIEFTKKGTEVNFDSEHAPVKVGEVESKYVPRYDGYYFIEYQWNTQWEPKTPEGYSTLYTHPLNQYSLPFMTLSGIIDTDSFNVNGPLRFLLREGFEGIIKKGTPMYQIIPFKREDYTIKSYDYNPELISLQSNVIINHNKQTKTDGAYKKYFWKNKRYL